MTLNLDRLIWEGLWEFLTEMPSKELKQLPDITVQNKQSAGEPCHQDRTCLGQVALSQTYYTEV